MNMQELRDLAAVTAKRLSEIRGEGWVIESEKDDTHPSVMLAEPGSGARLQLVWDYWATGKVTVVGVFPKDTAGGRYRASVDPERGGLAVASAADRRVLRDGYLDELPAMLARRAEMDAREENVKARLGQAADLFGGKAELFDRKVYVGEFVHGSGYVEMYSMSHPDTMSLSISGIPADVALKMLAVLAEHGKGLAGSPE